MASAQPMTFAALLRLHRRRAGLTQQGLAEKAGLSFRTVSDLERGVKHAPRVDTLSRLADALALGGRDRAEFNALGQRRVVALARAVPHTSQGASGPPLVGRARELDLLARHLAGEGPPVLLLTGEPGIGKSRLLAEAATRAQVGGWQVLAGGCTRRSGQEPYEPFVGMLANAIAAVAPALRRLQLAGCSWLAWLLPELAEAGTLAAPTTRLRAGQERRLMFTAVGRYLAAIAGPAGTLLVLDDLQWAGADALDLLATLVREPLGGSDGATPALRVLAAYRSTEVRRDDPLALLIADLARDELATLTRPSPLERDSAAELLDLMLAHASEADQFGRGGEVDLPSDVREEVLRRAEGIPFFLVSAARVLVDGGKEDTAGEGGRAALEGEWRVPWTVGQSIRARLSLLPEATRDLLGAAAVVGRVFVPAIVTAMLGWAEEEVVGALEAASVAGLLVDRAEAYRFAHDLIREVVLGDLSSARRRLLHRRAGRALEQLPVHTRRHPAELAQHFLEGGEAQKALPYLLQAGEQAEAAQAWAEAERSYRRALGIVSAAGDGPGEAELLEKLGGVLETAARYDEALVTFERAEQAQHVLGNQEARARISGRIAWAQAANGEGATAVARLERELADSETLSPQARSALYMTLAQVYATRGAFGSREAIEASERAEALALEAGDERGRVRAKARRGALLVETAGRGPEGAAALREVIPLAEAIDELWSLQRTFTGLGEWHRHAGQLEQARSYHSRALDVAQRRGDPMDITFALFLRGNVAFYVGDWRAARDDWTWAKALTHDLPASWRTGYSLAALGSIDLCEGQGELAENRFAEARAMARRGGDLQLERYIAWFEAERDLLDGRPAAALARLEPLLDRAGERSTQVTELMHLLAWAHLDEGDVGRAEATLAAGQARAKEDGYHVVIAEFLRIQGQVCAREGCWAEAEAALEEDLALCGEMPYLHEQVKALYVYGQMCAARRHPERAQEKYEAALAICHRLGERLYAIQIERALAELEARDEAV